MFRKVVNLVIYLRPLREDLNKTLNEKKDTYLGNLRVSVGKNRDGANQPE